MEHETALHLARELAQKVEGLQDNAAFATAVRAVRAELIEQWENSSPEHVPTERESIFQELHALRRVLRKLDEFVSDGAKAKHELAQIEVRQMRDTAA